MARESTAGSPFWVVARYDWSDPALVRWTVVESSYGGGGRGFVRTVARDGGGSLVHAEWANSEPRQQRLRLFVLHLVPNRIIARMWTAALDRYVVRKNN